MSNAELESRGTKMQNQATAFRRRDRIAIAAWAVIVVAVDTITHAGPVPVGLTPAQYKFTRLPPTTTPQGQPAPSAAIALFHVDVANPSKLWFRIRSSGPLAQTWIQPPGTFPGGGERIMPHNVGTVPYNGTYAHIDFDAETWQPGPFLLPTDDPGYQYIYEFQSRGVGQYSVHPTSSPSTTAAAITDVFSW